MIALLHLCQKIFSSEKGEEGFSVLEALVAMAIFSAALIPLLSLQSQYVRTVDGFQRTETRLQATDAALTHIRHLNLTKTPNGTLEMVTAKLSWEAQLAGPVQMTRGLGGIEGAHQIGLYDVKITLSYNNGIIDSFELRGLGWQQVSKSSE